MKLKFLTTFRINCSKLEHTKQGIKVNFRAILVNLVTLPALLNQVLPSQGISRHMGDGCRTADASRNMYEYIYSIQLTREQLL